MRNIVFYKTPSGQSPVQEFLNELSSKQARKVVWVLKIVQELEMVPRQYLKKLEGTEGLWEVRIQMGSDIFRILGFLDGAALVLTNGFAKKAQKTPLTEIAIAAQRKREYVGRKNKNGRRS